MRRKNSTGQKRGLVEVWKRIFLTLEIDYWLCQLMISLNPTKIALSCRVIISTRRMILLFVQYSEIPWTLRIVFYMHNMYEKCVEKILRARKEALSRSEKVFFDN